jgi:hypothetical protein
MQKRRHTIILQPPWYCDPSRSPNFDFGQVVIPDIISLTLPTSSAAVNGLGKNLKSMKRFPIPEARVVGNATHY